MKQALFYLLASVVVIVGVVFLYRFKNYEAKVNASEAVVVQPSLNKTSMYAKTENITQSDAPELKDFGKAPAFLGISHWLNGQPQTIDQLKGKVVLVDFI